ncbi:MAG: helicase-related protein, partial [Spirochaetota bacterium]|nr:helicase-related protein [Spirochaetota bacterium]
MKQPMEKSPNLISEDCISLMREEIKKCMGNEVFFVANCENSNIIDRVRVIARGNEQEVPVIYDEAFKGDYVIHNHPGGDLRPSENDIAIASYLGNQGIGFLITDNDISNCYVVVEGVLGSERHFLDSQELKSLLTDDGQVARAMTQYEIRDSQIVMLEDISRAFNEDLIALLEAGTGVGKSLAYLIPAIFWAVRNQEKVVISTNTINLQEQLVRKDIPFLKKALTQDFKAVLIKGRGNYLCIRKLYSVRTDDENELFESSETGWLETIIDSIDSLKEGSRDEIMDIAGLSAWEKIASETDTCLKGKCQHFSRCFFYRARKEVNQAQILVVNHHILCSDMAIKGVTEDSTMVYGLLPPYEKVIVDEAHNLESVAINYLGHSVSQYNFRQTLSRLYHLKGSAEKGILAMLKRTLSHLKSETDFEAIEEAHEILSNLVIPDILGLTQPVSLFFQLMLDYFQRQSDRQASENTMRVIPGKIDKSFANEMKTLGSTVTGMTQSLYDRLNQFIDKLHEIPFHIKEDFEGSIKDLEAQHGRLLSASNSLDSFIHFKESDAVFWLELRKRENTPWVRLNVSPLNVSDTLHDMFFSRKETVILTSATLTTNQSFRYLKDQIGLTHTEPERLIEQILPSPFDYEEQMSICIPTTLAFPQEKAFNQSVNEALASIVEKTSGKTFILFTSYGMLQNTYDYLNSRFNGQLSLLKQGSMNRHKLIDSFKQGNNTVLLGTDSFWEGVDVPGDALRCVILVKLPFKVPTEPITQGKVEKIEQNGGNSF